MSSSASWWRPKGEEEHGHRRNVSERLTSHVEIANEDPRISDRTSNVLDIAEEDVFVLMSSGSIEICKREGATVSVEGEVCCHKVLPFGVIEHRAGCSIPSRQIAPAAPLAPFIMQLDRRVGRKVFLFAGSRVASFVSCKAAKVGR
ncbi:hypothetical protein SEVIR_6G173666v4 [Setaria viridis]